MLQPQKQNTRATVAAAPTKGIIADAVYHEGALAFDAAIWLYNMIPSEYGCRVRDGSKEFATNIPFDTAAEVRTLMYYNSVVSGGSGGVDFFFAVTDAGVYDITAGGTTPVLSHAWANPAGDAGWCSHLNFTNVAGDHFLLVCDEDNGYWIFDGTTWAAGTFTGNPKPDPEKLVQITEWNGRIWFVEKDSATAWFLDPLALTGDITPMDVGNRFKEGGHLVQNSTWTLDDGAGMDDKFVQISSAGDVLVWSGVNPKTAADLLLDGRWYVGNVPEGRRVMSDWGGDIMVLSSKGLTKMTEIVAGGSFLDDGTSITNNISRIIRSELSKTINEYGWELTIHPAQDIVIISAPQPSLESSRAPIQFVMTTEKNTWCMYRDLDVKTMANTTQGFFFGTSDGRVLEHIGSIDNISLDSNTGSAIDFSLLSHYSNLGSPATWKRPQFVRPSWIGEVQPTYNIRIQYDFNLTELGTSPPFGDFDVSSWDLAIWDIDKWTGYAQNYLETIGTRGMGRYLAVALKGQSTNPLTYLGSDLMLDSGGLL